MVTDGRASTVSKGAKASKEETLAERVYQRTKKKILHGTYAPGAPLRLNALAEENGVSLIPVRDALQRLEGEGLVSSTPNKGARVALLSMTDMLEAYETRILLEVEALRRSYPHITARSLEQARSTKSEMVTAFSMGNLRAGLAAHRRLHFMLYEHSRSEWLLRFIQVLWDQTERYRWLVKPRLRGGPAGVGHEHDVVLDALERRQLGAAIDGLKDHLHHTVEVLVEAYGAQPGEMGKS